MQRDKATKDKAIVSRRLATSVFLLLLSWAMLGKPSAAVAAGTATNSSTNLALVGVVKDNKGTPIPKAWVFVDAARPRQGPGFL
jgi:hypothetical protein